MRIHVWLLVAVLAALPTLDARATIIELDTLNAADLLKTSKGPELSAGVEALRKGDATRAVDVARSVIATAPGNSQAHLLLLLGWLAQSNFNDIDHHLLEVRQRLPNLELPLREALAGALMREERWYRADRLLQGAPGSSQTDQVQFLKLAILAERGQIPQAVAGLKTLAQKLPKNAGVQLNLARLALLAKDAPASVAASTALLAMQPGDPRGMTLLVTGQLQRQNYPGAIAAADQWIKADPQNMYPLFLKGVVQIAAAQPGDALTTFRLAAKLKSDSAEVQLGIASAQLALRQWTEAKNAALASSKLVPTDGLPKLYVAAAALGSGDRVGAQAALRRATDLFADLGAAGIVLDRFAEAQDVTAASTLAHANFLYRYASPQSVIKQLAVATPSAPLIDLTRARAVRESGDLPRAVELYASLAQAWPALSVPVTERADVLFVLGRGGEAVKAYQGLVARRSPLPGLHTRLADLHNALGERDKAAAAYREQLKITPADRYTRAQLAATLALLGRAPDLQEALALTDSLLADRAAVADRDNVLDTRAGILVALGRSADALAIYTDLAKRNALHDTESWHRYGRLVLAANDRPRALRFIERALDSGASYPARDDDIKLLSGG